MTDKKFFTYEEIKTALECCQLTNEHQFEECEKCPLDEVPKTICQNLLAYYALDFVKRERIMLEQRKLRVEQANAEIGRLRDLYDTVIADLKYYLETNEENGVVHIPKFFVEKALNKWQEYENDR